LSRGGKGDDVAVPCGHRWNGSMLGNLSPKGKEIRLTREGALKGRKAGYLRGKRTTQMQGVNHIGGKGGKARGGVA